jgi:hypothetical protein
MKLWWCNQLIDKVTMSNHLITIEDPLVKATQINLFAANPVKSKRENHQLQNFVLFSGDLMS